MSETDFDKYYTAVCGGIARAVTDKRKANGWTRYELAKRAGVAQRVIKDIEDTGKCSFYSFFRVIKALEIDLMIL